MDEATLTFIIRAKTEEAVASIKAFAGTIKEEAGNVTSSFSGISLSGFSTTLRGAAKLASADLTSISGAAGGISTALSAVSGPAGLAAGAVIGVGTAIFAVTKNAADFAERIREMSAMTGISAQTLSTLNVGATKLGLDLNSLTPSFTLYLKNLSEAAHGNTSTAKTFTRFGIDAKKGIQDPDQAIKDLLDKLSKIPNSAERLDAAFKLAGRSGKNLALLAGEMKDGFIEMQKEAESLGVLLGEKDVERAHDFEVAWRMASLKVKGALLEVGEAAMPVVTEAIRALTKDTDKNKDSWQLLGEEMGEWAKGTASVIAAAGRVGDALDGIYNAANRAGLEMHKALMPPDSYAGQFTKWFGDWLQGPSGPGDSWRSGLGVVDGSKVKPQTLEQQRDTAEWNRRQAEAKDKPKPYTSGIGDVAHRARGGGGGHKSGAGEEDAETRAHIKELEIQQKTAERIYHETTDKIEREYRLRSLALADYVEQEKAAQATLIKAQLTTIDAEIAAAEKLHKSRDRDVKLAELKEKRAAAVSANNKEIQKIDDKAGEEQIATLRKKQEILYQMADEYDRRTVESYRYAADKRLITAETAENAIGNVELAALDRKKARIQDDLALMNEQSEAYKQQKVELALLEIQRASLVEEVARRVTAAHEKDLQEQRDYNKQLHDLQVQTRQINLEAQQARIGDMARHHASEREINRAQLAYELEDESQRHAEALNGIFDLQAEDMKRARTLADVLATLKKYHALIEAENQRHADADQRAQETAYAQENAGAISGEFRGAQPEFDKDGHIVKQATAGKNAIAGLNYALADFKKMGKESIGSFAQALGQTVSNFVLLGTTGPHALRKVTASVLAELAQQATVKAIMAFADGLVDLFVNPPKAAADFSAAALYASIAGGAALVGRATAGDLFQQQQSAGASSGSSSSSSTANSGPFIQNESTNRVISSNNQPTPIHLTIDLRSQTDGSHTLQIVGSELRQNPHGALGSVVLDVWHTDVDTNGRTRRKVESVAGIS